MSDYSRRNSRSTMIIKKKRHIFSLLLLTLGFTSMFAQSDRQFIRSGNKLFRAQNYAKAEAEYRKAIAQNAQNSQALYNLGCALMMQQKDSAAIVQYENAGKIETSKSRKAKVYHNIGVICQTHQMYGEAIEAYKESLRNNPQDNETRYNLALCKRLQKQQKKDNEQKKKDDKKGKDKEKKDNQQQKQKDNQQKQQNKPKDRMSKENAEQLLNAAMQQEKATQQRMKKAEQQPRSRKLKRNW